MEEAAYLAKFGSEVHLLVRRDVLRASKVMADRAMANPKIKMTWHTEVDDRFEGRGVGGTIARTALDAIAAEGGTRVRPDCPFIRGWIRRHPEYRRLLEERAPG